MDCAGERRGQVTSGAPWLAGEVKEGKGLTGVPPITLRRTDHPRDRCRPSPAGRGAVVARGSRAAGCSPADCSRWRAGAGTVVGGAAWPTPAMELGLGARLWISGKYVTVAAPGGPHLAALTASHFGDTETPRRGSGHTRPSAPRWTRPAGACHAAPAVGVASASTALCGCEPQQ